MLRRSSLLAALVLMATLFGPLAPAQAAPHPAPAPPAPGFAFFPETSHNIGLKIKRFYDTHGGLDIFGLPLTEVFNEDGLNVQYFERARFELHPELPPEFYVSLTPVLTVVDVTEQGRHSHTGGSKSGGANHAYADGSARYTRYGRSLCPANEWAATPAGRTNFAVCIY